MKKDLVEPSAPHRGRGRPLSFDREYALEQAMLTFWQHGYETTSITDLTTAMGVTAPSLYTAFGDKKRLFLEAVHRYVGDIDTIAKRIRSAETAYDAAREMLVASAMTFTEQSTPKGCLLASATASGSSGSADVQRAVADIRTAIAAHLCKRIDRDIKLGVMNAETNKAALAALVIAVIQGMSVLARDGASRDQLLDVVDTALGAWPSR